MSISVYQRFQFFLFIGLASAHAEHRVALVIGDDSVVPKLEKLGYVCSTSEAVDHNKLPRLIDSFAGRTPPRGTALVYFKGGARVEGDALHLVTTSGNTQPGAVRVAKAPKAAPTAKQPRRLQAPMPQGKRWRAVFSAATCTL